MELLYVTTTHRKAGLLAKELEVDTVGKMGIQDNAVEDGQAHQLPHQPKLCSGFNGCLAEPVGSRLLIECEHTIGLHAEQMPAVSLHT